MSDTKEEIMETAAAVAVADQVDNSREPQAEEMQVSTTAPSKSELPRPSHLPKPSGLKPPMKIGRMCSNAAPKPAVPLSPRTDGSTTDSVRKLSDELSRKHLSDLIEAEEDEVSSSLPDRRRIHRKASTGSAFSGTSMDALWEKHPRRLSEAGLRRSSDHSVVLTEDTDSFIIGERVWVGGSKPGQIAYIGETQFAPGDWAGIVLDDPIGKNDGSVAGVRYFQCADKRGVFSRLTRLTRTPLVQYHGHDASPVSDAGSVFERPPSGMGRSRRTLSPNGSIRSVVSSKMNASVITRTNGDVNVGDRVIVSSSRGSKAGILRYVGETDFATGVWAGVELDDPLGKNDGSVDGKRYFECSPRFGLFAPMSKVSRSPSNRKPGHCAIHNGRATPLRRSNSRESLVSMTTSITSSRPAQRYGAPRAASTPVSAKNALQEMLREKQHHLELLMKERELERAEVAKFTLQAGRAESALAHLKKETAVTTSENERLKAELDRLNKMIEDERQKVEDLMFRNEEENINKEDYNKYKEEMEKIKAELEKRLRSSEAEAALQRARADAASSALQQAAEQRDLDLAARELQHKEDMDAAQSLSSELQKLLDEAYALLREKENEKDSMCKSLSEELSKQKLESDRALNEAKSKITIAQTEFEAQMSMLTSKLQMTESKLELEKQNVERLSKDQSETIIELNSKLTQLQAVVEDKTQELQKATGASKEHELNLQKEITKLKMELSAKVLDLEQLGESQKKNEDQCRSFQEEISRLREEHATKISEYESLLSESTQQNENTLSEIRELQQRLAVKTKEYERLLNETNVNHSSTEKRLSEFMETIHERDKEIIKLKDEYEQATAKFNIHQSKIAEEHQKEIDDRNKKIEELQKAIQDQDSALKQSQTAFESLNSQFIGHVDEIKALRDENDQLKQTILEVTKTNNDLKTRISAMELEIGESKRQLKSTTEKCTELQKAKDRIEEEYMNVTGQASDSNEQFNKLSQHLKETEKELQELKDKYRESTNNNGRKEQELQQKYIKLEEDFSLEREKLFKLRDDAIAKYDAAEIKLKGYEEQLSNLQNTIADYEATKNNMSDENGKLNNEILSLKLKEKDMISEYSLLKKQMQDEIDKYKQEVSLLKADGASSEIKLMEKVDQLTEAQNDLNNKLEEAKKQEDALQKVIDAMNSKLDNQKNQYEKEMSQVKHELNEVKHEANSLKNEEAKLNELLVEKENSLKDAVLKFEILQVDLKSNSDILAEKDRQISELAMELKKGSEIKKELEEKFNVLNIEASTLKQQLEKDNAELLVKETLINEQQSVIETLKKDLAVLNQDEISVKNNYNEANENLKKMTSVYEEVVKKLKENDNINNELKNVLAEKEKLLNTQNEKYKSELNKISDLDQEVTSLKKELSSKNMALEEKELQLKNLNELLNADTNKTQEKIKNILEEKIELEETHKKETEEMSVMCKTLQSQIIDQQKQIEELQKDKSKVLELQELLSKSENDIKQLTNINEGQKTNYEELQKDLQLRYDEYKKDSKKARHDLRAKIEEYEKQLHESKESSKLETEKQNQTQEKLNAAENTIVELRNKLELMSVHQTSNENKESQLETLTLEVQTLRKENSDALANSASALSKLRSEIETKSKEMKQKDDLLTKLQKDIFDLKAKIEITEREKILMQKQLESLPKESIIKDKNDNRHIGQGDEKSMKSLESEEVEGQVSFLNSVIVDMQRKNEQLIARVQALEGGALVVENEFAVRKPRAVAPRLWCDICDVFDAHDTDECPKQEPAPAAVSNTRAPPSQRPYCDICEVFGHATENCDEEETF